MEPMTTQQSRELVLLLDKGVSLDEIAAKYQLSRKEFLELAVGSVAAWIRTDTGGIK